MLCGAVPQLPFWEFPSLGQIKYLKLKVVYFGCNSYPLAYPDCGLVLILFVSVFSDSCYASETNASLSLNFLLQSKPCINIDDYYRVWICTTFVQHFFTGTNTNKT